MGLSQTYKELRKAQVQALKFVINRGDIPPLTTFSTNIDFSIRVAFVFEVFNTQTSYCIPIINHRMTAPGADDISVRRSGCSEFRIRKHHYACTSIPFMVDGRKNTKGWCSGCYNHVLSFMHGSSISRRIVPTPSLTRPRFGQGTNRIPVPIGKPIEHNPMMGFVSSKRVSVESELESHHSIFDGGGHD